MNAKLAPEEQEWLDGFRRFLAKEIAPHTEESDERGAIPREHYHKLGAAGYNGLLHEERYGGQHANHVLACAAQIALSEVCGSTFFSAGASAGLFGMPLAHHGSEAQKQQWLPDVLRGDRIGCLAVTEPQAGSDVSALRCRAEQQSDDTFRLTGQKTYITNAPNADVALVLARYRRKDGMDRGLTHFIVPLDASGVSRGKPMKKMGLRASPTGELFFEDVELPADSVLAGPGQGFRLTMEAFIHERLALAAYSVGVMNACLDDARSFSKTRKSFGRAIGKHQSVAFMLADIAVKRRAAELLLYETAWLFDQIEARDAKQDATPDSSAAKAIPMTGSAPAQLDPSEATASGAATAAQPKHSRKRKAPFVYNGMPVDLNARAASVKLLASTYAREVANLAVQVHGGAGFMEEYRVARMYRDVKLAEIGGGTSEIQKQIIARSEYKRVK